MRSMMVEMMTPVARPSIAQSVYEILFIGVIDCGPARVLWIGAWFCGEPSLDLHDAAAMVAGSVALI